MHTYEFQVKSEQVNPVDHVSSMAGLPHHGLMPVEIMESWSNQTVLNGETEDPILTVKNMDISFSVRSKNLKDAMIIAGNFIQELGRKLG